MKYVNCATCKKKLDLENQATTECLSCKEIFCCNLLSDCASKYHKEKECSGEYASILNPSFKICLREKAK